MALRLLSVETLFWHTQLLLFDSSTSPRQPAWTTDNALTCCLIWLSSSFCRAQVPASGCRSTVRSKAFDAGRKRKPSLRRGSTLHASTISRSSWFPTFGRSGIYGAQRESPASGRLKECWIMTRRSFSECLRSANRVCSHTVWLNPGHSSDNSSNRPFLCHLRVFIFAVFICLVLAQPLVNRREADA